MSAYDDNYCSKTFKQCKESNNGCWCLKTHMDLPADRSRRLVNILCHERSVSNTDKLNEIRTCFGANTLFKMVHTAYFTITLEEIESLLSTKYACFTRCLGSPRIRLTNAMKVNHLRGIFMGEHFAIEYILKRKDPNVNDTSRLNSLIDIAYMVGHVWEMLVSTHIPYDATYDCDMLELLLYRKPFTVKINDIDVKELVTDTDRIDYLKQLFDM